METATLKHTPGPWYVNAHDICKGSMAVAAVYGTSSHAFAAEAKANAHLIAAAPELLAAAVKALELIDGYIDVTDGPDGKPAANGAMQAARVLQTAIAKAEGR